MPNAQPKASAADELAEFRQTISGMSDQELAALEAVLRRAAERYREELLALEYVIHRRMEKDMRRVKSPR